jgi:putative membrane protein
MTNGAETKHKESLADVLARDRTAMANERTFLAYIRTSLVLLITGGTIIRILGTKNIDLAAGYTFVILGVFVIIFGFIRFGMLRRRLERLHRNWKS